MTALLDRTEDIPVIDLPAGARTPPSGIAIGATLAALSAAAGIIHLVMAPSHLAEWTAEGVGFLIAGWLQIALAGLWMWHPSRIVGAVSVFVNGVLIGLWIVSRTSGWPTGPHAHIAESVGTIDFSIVVMQGLLVLAGVFAMITGAITSKGVPRLLSLGAPLAIAGLVSALLVSPSARNHAHSHADNHAVSSATQSATHTHTANEGLAAAPTAAAAPEAISHVHTEAVAFVEPGAPVGVNTNAAPVDDKGLSLVMNGHQHEHVYQPLSLQDNIRLNAQLAPSLDLAARDPTIAEAEAAGYRRAGP